MYNKITAGQPDTLKANCLNACDTPTWPGGAVVYPSGTIYRYDGLHCYPGSLPLYIVP